MIAVPVRTRTLTFVFPGRRSRPARRRRLPEHAEFLGNLYGTPTPEAPPGRDLVLEITQGAAQVVSPTRRLADLHRGPQPAGPGARLRHRGDPEDIIQARLAKAAAEAARSQELGAHVVVNDDVERATGEVLDLIVAARAAQRT
ncbi:MAG: hypothetical protein R2749_19540 [Acidimicrobiales bacterium]